jgi:hypothetical protein
MKILSFNLVISVSAGDDRDNCRDVMSSPNMPKALIMHKLRSLQDLVAAPWIWPTLQRMLDICFGRATNLVYGIDGSA